MRSVWGEVIKKVNVAKGVRSVLTDKNEGLLLTAAFARRHMPRESYDGMPFYSGSYCFEKSKDAFLPFFFIPELIYAYRKNMGLGVDYEGLTEFHKEVIDSVKRLFPEIYDKYPELASPCEYWASKMGLAEWKRRS